MLLSVLVALQIPGSDAVAAAATPKTLARPIRRARRSVAATPPSAHYEATTATYANPVVLDWIIDVDMQDHDSGELVTQSFLLDSGSSNFAVAVADCVSCPSNTAEYKLVTLGAADDPKLCTKIEYGDNSGWSGYLTKPTLVRLDASFEPTEMEMAAITSQKEFFNDGQFSKYTGILGVGYKDLTTSFSDTKCTTKKKKKKTSSTTTASTAAGGAESWTGASPSEVFYDHMRAAVYMAWGASESAAKSASATTSLSSSAARSSSTSTSKSTKVVPKTFIDYLYDAKQIDTKLMSILICADDKATVTFGGVDPSCDASSIAYSSVVADSEGFHMVAVEDITVAGESIAAKGETVMHEIKKSGQNGMIVDTGTTIMYLPSTLYESLKKKVKKAVEPYGGLSESFFSGSDAIVSGLSALPTITYTLKPLSAKSAPVVINLEPKQYLVETDGSYSWGFGKDDGGPCIFGNIAMIDINIVFDMSSKTVGFAAGTCSDVGANGYHPATATSASTPASTTTSNFAAVAKTSGERLVLKRTNSGAMLDVLEAETGGGAAGAGTGAKGGLLARLWTPQTVVVAFATLRWSFVAAMLSLLAWNWCNNNSSKRRRAERKREGATMDRFESQSSRRHFNPSAAELAAVDERKFEPLISTE